MLCTDTRIIIIMLTMSFFISYIFIRKFSKDIFFNMNKNVLKSMYINKLQDKKFLRLKLNAQKILKYQLLKNVGVKLW